MAEYHPENYSLKPEQQDAQDISIDNLVEELDFLQDITLEELGITSNITLEDLGIVKPKNENNAKKTRTALRTALAGLLVFAGSAVAGNTLLSEASTNESSPSEQPSSTPRIAPTTVTQEQQEQLPNLHIQPRETFLTADGQLETPDYIISAPSIGSTIYSYVRPAAEESLIGGEVNSNPTDVVVPAVVPQVITPQLQEYAANNPDFVPTYERGLTRGKKNAYWNGKAASEFQKTAMQLYGKSYQPGEKGNSVQLLHASTRSAAAGDMPAMNIGDQLYVESPADGNKYAYKLHEVEIIDVDNEGNLTSQELMKQIDKGHHANVTANEVIYNYIGHEHESTLTVQLCGDRDGIPGGTNSTSAKEARVIYRYILDVEESRINTMYENLIDSLNNSLL